ncbi:siderophore ABC transporter substrate-binding protein [Paenibacillus sp. YSY-4.3]
MNKKLSLLVVSLVFVFVLAACGADKGNNTANTGNAPEASAPAAEAPAENEELSITHQLGTTTLKKNPGNIAVFDYGTLESLDKLGVEVTGVPQSNLPPHLKKYEDSKYTNVGTLKEPDFEKLNAMKPGVIFISGRTGEAYDELSQIAPTIYLGVDNAKYLESMKENLDILGQIFGKEAEVDQEWGAIEDSVKAINEQVAAGEGKGLVILTNGGKVSAYGPGSRFGIIHDEFGIAPADDTLEVSTHGQSISFEFVAEKNPDYLFVVDRDSVVSDAGTQAEPASKLVENDLVKKTNAYKNGKIIYLDASYWYLSGGGLISVPEMAKEVQEGIK